LSVGLEIILVSENLSRIRLIVLGIHVDSTEPRTWTYFKVLNQTHSQGISQLFFLILTGLPKGIAPSHFSALNLLGFMQKLVVSNTSVLATTCFFHVSGFFTGTVLYNQQLFQPKQFMLRAQWVNIFNKMSNALESLNREEKGKQKNADN
jgi:hypothetical protein